MRNTKKAEKIKKSTKKKYRNTHLDCIIKNFFHDRLSLDKCLILAILRQHQIYKIVIFKKNV